MNNQVKPEKNTLLNGRLADMLSGQDNLVSIRKVIEECHKLKIPMNLRTLQFYASEGLIEKSIRIGREAYYEEKYIFDQLAAIYILKRKFKRTLGQIKKIIFQHRESLKKILLQLERLVEDYNPASKKLMPGVVSVRDDQNRKIINEVELSNLIRKLIIEAYLLAIEMGASPSKISLADLENLIREIVYDYAEEVSQKERKKMLYHGISTILGRKK